MSLSSSGIGRSLTPRRVALVLAGAMALMAPRAPGEDGPEVFARNLRATLAVRFAEGKSHHLLGSRAELNAEVVLSTTNPRVEGWSYGLTHDPDRLRLVTDSLSIGSVDQVPGVRPFFEFLEIVANGAGFTSTVLLSFEGGVFLDAVDSATLARVRYEVIDAGFEFTRLEFSGPVFFIVDGEELRPSHQKAGVVLRGPDGTGGHEELCSGPESLDHPCARRPGAASVCSANVLGIRFGSREGASHSRAAPGEVIRVVVVVDATDTLYGWSTGIAHDPEVLELLEGTPSILGTDAHAGIAGTYFDISHSAPATDDSPEGCVVAFSYGLHGELFPGVRTLAFAEYRVVGEIPREGTWLRLDGSIHRPPSPPYGLFVSGSCGSGIPWFVRDALLLPPGDRFRRGDANDDGRVDLADAVAVVDFLFLRRGDDSCLDAFDADDNERVDLVDAVALLGAMFDGAGVPARLNVCGADAAGDELGCSRLACPDSP